MAGHESRAIFQATITADPKTFAALDDLDIDFLPTREKRPKGRWAIEAIVQLEQLRDVVAAGCVVELKRVVDPAFPRDRIMSPEAARERLKRLERFRRTRG